MSDDLKTQILSALKKLDPKNDDHWTEQGLPRLDALDLGDAKVGRQAVTAAAPLFTRSTSTLDQFTAASTSPSPDDFKPETAPQLSDEDMELLTLAVQEAEDKVQAQDKALNDARKGLSDAQAQRDALLAQMEKSGRPQHKLNQEGIQAVLARSRQVREEKAQLANVLKGHGITAKLLQAKSALDLDMARKTSLTKGRPNFTARS